MQEPNVPLNLSFDNTKLAFKHLSNKELKKSYWLFKVISNQVMSGVGPFLTKTALFFRLPISGLIKATLFKQFCGGETLEEATPTVLRLFANNVGSVLDYSVEGEENEVVFDHSAQQILKCIDKTMEFPDAIPFCVFKMTAIARFSLLEKISNKQELKGYEQLEWQKALERVDMICRTASEFSQYIMIDAEESWIQSAIDEVALKMMEKYNVKKAIVFNTYQLYRTDKLAALITDLTIAKTHGFVLGVKLVRGAYLEKERKRALENSYPSPIHHTKEDTDCDFNASVSFCLENIEDVILMIGTHNLLSCEILIEKMEQRQIASNHPHIYFAQLLGMSDNISFNLAHHHFNVAKYVPFGPVKSVMPYLLRRAEENSAIAGQMGRELKLIKLELARRERSTD